MNQYAALHFNNETLLQIMYTMRDFHPMPLRYAIELTQQEWKKSNSQMEIHRFFFTLSLLNNCSSLKNGILNSFFFALNIGFRHGDHVAKLTEKIRFFSVVTLYEFSHG